MRDRGSRPRRLLRHARGEVGVRPPQALRDRAGDRLDLLLERLVHDELEPRCARDELHRAVVVRRAETAGDEARVGLQSLSQHRLELGGRVPDDRDPGRLEAVAQRLGGEEGAVPVGALAADELAAGDDDDRARPLGSPAQASRPLRGDEDAEVVHGRQRDRAAVERDAQAGGRAHEEVEAVAREPVGLPRVDGCLQVDLAGRRCCGAPRRTSPADAVQDELARRAGDGASASSRLRARASTSRGC